MYVPLSGAMQSWSPQHYGARGLELTADGLDQHLLVTLVWLKLQQQV